MTLYETITSAVRHLISHMIPICLSPFLVLFCFFLLTHLVKLRGCRRSPPLSLFKTSIGGQNSKWCDPLHNLKPKCFPRLFYELNGQVSNTHTRTHTWHLNEVQGSWAEKWIEQKKGKLKLSKRAGNPTTKGSRQWYLDHAELPRPLGSEGCWRFGNRTTNQSPWSRCQNTIWSPDTTCAVL